MVNETGTGGNGDRHDGGSPIPPIKNPAVDGAQPRRNYWLPWVLLGLALLALILMLTQCGRDGDRERNEAIARDQAAQQQAATGAAAAGTLGNEVGAYLQSGNVTERSFAFGQLNFDTGSAEIRDVEQSDIVGLAEALKAHPGVRAAVVGYADARGDDQANARLGAQRAQAVIAALKARGVDTSNIEARTGGELNPAATSDTAEGLAKSRRTEFVVLANQG